MVIKLGSKPKVGVSRCLLGDAVRYDGDSKPNTVIIKELSELFELVAVCPEVEAGLPVPRPPVQLTGDILKPRLTGRDDPTIDITDLMLNYCREKSTSLNDINGFIFKSRSPSCGLNSTPVFIDNKVALENGRGLFASTLCRNIPSLPVIEDIDLESKAACLKFIAAVERYKQQSNF